MRSIAVVAALLCLVGSGCHGGYFFTGAGALEPDFGDTVSADAGVVSYVGAGGPLSEGGDLSGELFGGLSDNDVQHVLVGLGVRGTLSEADSGRLYWRGGGAYQNIESGLVEGGGTYLGLGYDIWLDDAKTFSIAPEVMAYYWLGDVQGFFGSSTEDIFSGSVGISLTYRFGGGRKSSSSDEPLRRPY